LLSLFKIDYNNSKQTLLSSTIKGFTTYLEYVGYGIITLSAYNMGDLFIPHIILYSILSIPHTISEGFGLTIKNYLIEMKHIKASYQSRKKYILSFVLLVITSALIFSLILLAFEDKLAALYYPSLTVDMKKLYSDVISYYSIFIIFDFFSVVLDGFITGKEGESNRLSIYKAIVFCLICIPIGFGFTFYYNVGIIGIWMTIFLYISIHFLVEIIYVYKVHGLYAFKE
jgi:Na+-driven multidrug efflux pump